MPIRIHGRVDGELVLTDEDLESMAASSGGMELPIGDLLALAELDPEATHCTVIAAGGSYRASIPLVDLGAGGRLSFSGDGGSPRLTVVDGATLCWNVKQVGELKVTLGPEPDDVPDRPTH